MSPGNTYLRHHLSHTAKTLLATGIAVLAILAQPASAAVTVGSDLSATPDGACPPFLDPCTAVMLTSGATATKVPSDGVIAKVRVKSLDSVNGMRWTVLREVGDTTPVTAGTFSGAPRKIFNGIASETTNLVGGAGGFVNVFDARVSVQAGDRIGFESPAGTTHPTIAKDIGDPAIAGLGVALDESSAPLPQPVGGNVPYAYGWPQSVETLMNVTVEPDADRDGYGDETQDQCPTDASTQGACPASADTTGPQVTISNKAAKLSKKGAVSVNVTCPSSESGGCKGTLALTTAGKVSVASVTAAKAKKKKKVVKLGSASFSIAGGQTQAVKVKLSGKAKRAVKKLRKVKVKATATATDVANNAATATATFTLKA